MQYFLSVSEAKFHSKIKVNLIVLSSRIVESSAVRTFELATHEQA